MIVLRRKTREALRHERAVVFQELGDRAAAANPINDWQARQKLELERMRAARRRQRTTTPPEQPSGGGGSSEN